MKALLATLTVALALPLLTRRAHAEAEGAAVVPTAFALAAVNKDLGEQGWKDYVAAMDKKFRDKEAEASRINQSYSRSQFLTGGLLPLGLRIYGKPTPENVKDGFMWVALYQEWKESSERIDGVAPKIQSELRDLNTLLNSLDWTPANQAASSGKFWQRAADLIVAYKENSKKK